MKKSLSMMLTALLIVFGLSLLAMGIMYGRFRQEEYRSMMVIILAGEFLVLMLVTVVFSRFVQDDYKPAFLTTLLLLSTGLAMLGAFFGVMWAMFDTSTYGIFIAVMLPCYGLALIMTGVANHFLSQKAYRPYIYDFFRQLPYVYYRYRT